MGKPLYNYAERHASVDLNGGPDLATLLEKSRDDEELLKQTLKLLSRPQSIVSEEVRALKRKLEERLG